MKDGDFAGLCLLQKNYGLVGVRLNGNNKSIVMINASGGKAVASAAVSVTQNIIYFKAQCDFTDKKDVADFFYSIDGNTCIPVGTQLKMAYTLPHLWVIVLACLTMLQNKLAGMRILIISI